MANQSVKYLVTGASGQLGGLVIDELVAKVPADNVVALVRRADAAGPLEAKGVEVRIADYEDRAALEKAFAGIDRLLLISSSEVGKRIGQHENAVAAAKAAGVGFLAYTSILKAGQFDFGLSDEHAATEALIRDAGVPYAFLRNSWYTENNAMAAGPALQFGVVMGAAGDGRISGATRQDYAEGAVAVLTADTPEPNATYELAGDESYSLADVAAEIADASGKEVSYASMTREEYKGALQQAGLPEPVAEMLSSADAAAAKGALEDNSKTLSGLIGRPTTPWRETIREATAEAQRAS